MTIHPTYHLSIFETPDALQEAAVEYIILKASESIATKGRFVIALSGGQTPKEIYSLLATPPFRKQMDWDRTFIFWGDERCVPLHDLRNNAHQAFSMLLDKVPVPAGNIHRIQVNLPPQQAAMAYQKDLEVFFGTSPHRFDLILLGLGENGHTASLFPLTSVLEDQEEGVKAVFVEEEKMFRITMNAPLINQAHHILFLVTGIKKASILNKILNDPFQQDVYPAQLIHPQEGTLSWFVDQEAASLLRS